jgi:long-chain acyl-CoA synthetase
MWAARSAGVAQRMREAGLQPGDRIVLFMRNHPRYLELLWGAWWAGLAVVPVNAKLHPAEVEWIVADAQARWAFVTGRCRAAAACRAGAAGRHRIAEADALLAPVPDCAGGADQPSAPPTTWPGSSTPAAPPAGPRA